MSEYQLRAQDEDGVDTGAIELKDTLEEAMEAFLNGGYWKLSWTRPSGQRVRLVRISERYIEVTDPAEWSKLEDDPSRSEDEEAETTGR